MAPVCVGAGRSAVSGTPVTVAVQQHKNMKQGRDVSQSEATSGVSRSSCVPYFSLFTSSNRFLRTAAVVGAALLASVYSCGEIFPNSINSTAGDEVGWWRLQAALADEVPNEKKESGEEDTASPPQLSGAKLAELLQLGLGDVRERMDSLFGMIDTNGDDRVDVEEARRWSLKLKAAMHQHQVEMEFQAIDKNGDGKVSFDELAATYVSGSDPKQLEEHKEEVRKRFSAVDKDGNDLLDVDEVTLLMDPGKDEKLTQLEIEEILATQDKNKDRKITLQEFIETEGGTVSESEKEELQKEFSAYDLDKDGSIDAEELHKIIKDPHAHEIEALLEDFLKELKDGVLTKKRWMNEYEKFAVSMLTDNGEVLRYPDDYKGMKFPYSASTSTPTAEKESKEHDEL